MSDDKLRQAQIEQRLSEIEDRLREILALVKQIALGMGIRVENRQ